MLSEQHHRVVGSRLLPIPGPEGALRGKVRALDRALSGWVGLAVPGGIFGITATGGEVRARILRRVVAVCDLHVKRRDTHVAEAERDFGQHTHTGEESPREVSSCTVAPSLNLNARLLQRQRLERLRHWLALIIQLFVSIDVVPRAGIGRSIDRLRLSDADRGIHRNLP